MISKEELKLKILKDMFPNGYNEYAGYWNIVKILVNEGECISTSFASGISFGLMNKFITIVPYEVDFIAISLDKEKAIKSEEFLKAKIAEKNIIQDNINETQSKLNILRDEMKLLELID